jgi:hypothetical protein
MEMEGRFQWPSGLGCAVDRLLGLRFRILPVAWLCVLCIFVLSARGLCVGPITRPEESTECGVSLCVLKKPQE